MRVFITGLAGFIGFHTALALHAAGATVFGMDNFNDFYDPAWKRKRAEILNKEGIDTLELELSDLGLKGIIEDFQPTHLLHLAAQAGVRYSLTNPQAYVKSNIEGFTHILEIVRTRPSTRLVYASSSSVYGLNAKLPFSVKERTDQQASFYGVTKKANELMAASYSHLFGIQATGLRYFTVYGPWGRPDMALFSFTRSILEGRPIDLYNNGNMQRDFTYIDDIVSGTIGALNYSGKTPLFNLGHHAPVALTRMVDLLEKALNKKAIRNLLPMQPGDVVSTYADIKESQDELGFNPTTDLEVGIQKFVDWYMHK